MSRHTVLNESPDKRIDAALGVVGNCSVPSGMEVRVQQRLLSAVESELAGSRRWGRVSTGVGVAAAIVMAILISLHSGPVKHTQIANAPAALTGMQMAASHRADLIQPTRSQGMESGRVVTIARRRGRISVRRHAATLLNYPLTKQERLLVQFARTATPAELQMLNPEYQAKVEAQQEADFAAYLRSGDETGPQERQVATDRQTTQER